MKTLVSFSLAALVATGIASTATAQQPPVQQPNVSPTTVPVSTQIAMCTGCHNIPGYQASFPEVHKVPMIAGQSAKYIANSLMAYRKGERKHPTMRSVAVTMSDADINAVADYYSKLGQAEPAPAKPEHTPPANVAALLQKANCASCHGENFSKPIDPSYPKLAGQYADYLYVALKSYQIDNNPHIGRGNAIMQGMARPYTRAELRVLANYLASLPGELRLIEQSRFR
ncbi:c-type cytochrome [Piscinibacter koreensis]|uniref:C-type cytochrome n=1 Tax=Piscinibacter koreensis TaxID=2742824 RepID=A0A7Y6NMK2_9BURK|nr:c-type cytochrome [Schlegelella koreensis]